MAISPLVSLDLLKTNFKALKKIQYNIVNIIKNENQKIASKTINNITIRIVIPIHNRIDKIKPPIPSPTSIIGDSKGGEAFSNIVPLLKLLNFGKLSINPIPL